MNTYVQYNVIRLLYRYIFNRGEKIKCRLHREFNYFIKKAFRRKLLYCGETLGIGNNILNMF